MKFTYFDFEGRGEAPRLAFHLGGLKWEDERLSIPEFRALQKEEKYKYNQVPVLQIGDKQYAQSLAILRYAGQLGNLYPSNPLEQLACDEAVYTVEEVYSKVAATFSEDKEEMKKRRLEFDEKTVKPWLKFLERDMAQRKTQYMVGNQMTIADIQLFSLVRFIKTGFLDHVDNDMTPYPSLTQFHQTMMGHPKIVEWYQNHGTKTQKDLLTQKNGK